MVAWVSNMLVRMRRWDKLAMLFVGIPMVVLVLTLVSNRAIAYQTSDSQAVLNAVANAHLSELDRRLNAMETNFNQRQDRSETFQNAEVAALLGVFAALVTSILQNRNKRR